MVQQKRLNKMGFILSSLGNVAVLWLLWLEAYAFSQPVVSKANTIVEHSITIAQAVIGIGIIWFVFTLLMNRPNFRIVICTTFAGVIIGAFGAFAGFFGGRWH